MVKSPISLHVTHMHMCHFAPNDIIIIITLAYLLSDYQPCKVIKNGAPKVQQRARMDRRSLYSHKGILNGNQCSKLVGVASRGSCNLLPKYCMVNGQILNTLTHTRIDKVTVWEIVAIQNQSIHA